ncbi:MAG: hypothetical protein PWQ92_858 [Thermococcaceae archaeon]|jgi:hypothetical protein|nr:hypothetical protein [Thermococcaceae archaeon]
MGFSKPEEVYGDRWHEFLKRRGVKVEEVKREEVKGGGVKPEEVVGMEKLKREAGKVEVIHLETASWLGAQLVALKDSLNARLRGGVPAAELRYLRDKLLARKHALDKVLELVETEWMSGNVAQLDEASIDPKVLSYMREQVLEALEYVGKLSEWVKEGELDPTTPGWCLWPRETFWTGFKRGLRKYLAVRNICWRITTPPALRRCTS